jgi:hypothetical protein
MGDIELVRLFLEKTNMVPSANLNLPSSLGESTVEMMEFFLDYEPQLKDNSSFLLSALREAVIANNVPIVRLLLPYDVNVKSLFLSLSTTTRSDAPLDRIEILRLLLLDPRLDLSLIRLNSNLLSALKPLIGSRLVGAYRGWNGSIYDIKPKLLVGGYISLLERLILQQATIREAIHWLTKEDNAYARHAARVIVSNNSIVVHIEIIDAYSGYFLLFLYNLTIDEMKDSMMDAHCSQHGINLASQLVGAQRGIDDESYTDDEYENAIRLLLEP